MIKHIHFSNKKSFSYVDGIVIYFVLLKSIYVSMYDSVDNDSKQMGGEILECSTYVREFTGVDLIRFVWT